MTAPGAAEAEAIHEYEQQKGKLLEQSSSGQKKLATLKSERKEAPRHVLLKDLPEPERFPELPTARKHFVDTIKLIAYRAETALVQIAREKLQRAEDARALIRQVFTSAVDLSPNLDHKTLTVRLHRLTSAAHDQVLEHLCAELTATETTFPETDLRLVFAPVQSQ